MLVSNPVAVLIPYHFDKPHIIRQREIYNAEVQLADTDHTYHQLSSRIEQLQLNLIAFRSPLTLGDNLSNDGLDKLRKLLVETARCFHMNKNKYFILHTAPVTLPDIFSYLDLNPDDFTALDEFKEKWIDNCIKQILFLKEEAEQSGVQLLLENAPMGSMHYFEPGQGQIYPGFRTPQDLLKVIDRTGIGISFQTGFARMTSNILTYMRRSRSLFFGATEYEVLNSTVDWILYFEKIAEHVKLVHLFDTISLGDTECSRKVPFRRETWSELEKFASLLSLAIPVVFDFPSYDPEKSKPYKEFIQLWTHYPSF